MWRDASYPSNDLAVRETVAPSEQSDRNLLSGLDSLNRLSKRDQERIELRLRDLSMRAKAEGSIGVAANLIRAVYQLEKPGRCYE